MLVSTRLDNMTLWRTLTLSPWTHLSALVLLDVGITSAGGFMLWVFGGETVVSGPVIGRILSFSTSSALLGVRQLVAQRLSALSVTANSSKQFRQQCIILICNASLLLGAILAWHLLGSYMLGWLACFASIYLTAASWWQLIAAVSSPNSLRPVLLRVAGFMIGIAGIFSTAMVHQWNQSILGTSATLASAEIILVTIALYWVRALQRKNSNVSFR